MTYDEFAKRALAGRSVNQAAKDWDVPQPTLDKWVKGKNLPDYVTAVKMAEDAHMPLQEAMVILAREEVRRKKKPVVAAIAAAAVTLFLTASPDTAQAAAYGSRIDNNADYGPTTTYKNAPTGQGAAP